MDILNSVIPALRLAFTLQAMLKRYFLLMIFSLTVFSDLFGQTKLKDNLVADSVILKLKVKQITENGFGNINDQNPYWATFEAFDTTGRIIKRTFINYGYHKFVYDFKYNTRKNEIIVTEKYFDWGSHREKNKNDTTVKTSTEKYNLRTKGYKDFKSSGFKEFQAILTKDISGRLIQSKDTIKFGYQITYYQYDDKNHLVERKRLITRQSGNPELFSLDSLTYNSKGQRTKEVNYFDFKIENGITKHDREVETIFNYENNGLLKERLITTKYLSFKKSKPGTTIFRYEYLFY
ncbi:MAG: hypothetical protein WDO16_19800 [Bacteroidota bacterium]